MIAQIIHVATLNGGAAGAFPITSLEVFDASGSVTLQAYTSSGQHIQSWTLGTAAEAATETGAVDPGAAFGVSQIALGQTGATRLLSDDQFGRITNSGDLTVALDQSVMTAFQVETAWSDFGSFGWLYAEDPSGGVASYRVSDADLAGSGTLTLSQTALAGTGGIDDLLTVSQNGMDYLLGVSADSDDITVWKTDASGALTETGTLPPGQGVGNPEAVASMVVEGITYVAVAGAASGSLSLYQLTAMGGLERSDFVLDDTAQTRFAGARILESATVEGRSYLVAAGHDQGLSVLEVLPGGRLLHMASVGDTTATTLATISSIALEASGGSLQIFATGPSESGVTQFSFDPGTAGLTLTGSNSDDGLTGGALNDILTGEGGNDTLSGGAGDDILIDGSGSDAMSGGSGADVFLLTADGVSDTITDYDTTEDRLDLSAFTMLYDLRQIQVVATSFGARLLFRDEEVRVHSVNGGSLSASDFSNETLLNLNRPPWGIFTERTKIEGTATDDILVSAVRDAEILGMDGDDRLTSMAGSNMIRGGDGIDTLDYSAVPFAVAADLQAGLVTLSDDWSDQLEGIERLMGSAFGDLLAGDLGANGLFGNAGADTLVGGSGADELRGGTDNDWLQGGNGNDTLFGNQQDDLIFSDTGDDQLSGGDGDDTLYGGKGDDTLWGNPGGDVLRAEEGADLVFGGRGDDNATGGSGNDTLWGGAGADTLSGGLDDDWLRGGQGRDTFVFSQGADWIDDFSTLGDTLRLDEGLWEGFLSPGQVAANFGAASGGNYVMNFGDGNVLTLAGSINETELEALISFI